MRVIITTVVFLILDSIWLGLIAPSLYKSHLASILRMAGGAIQPRWPAVIIVYIALIGGILLFVIPKAQGKPLWALLWGAVFGFVTYATYDFTNHAVVSEWPLIVAIIDTLWGMVLCGVTSFVTVWLCRS